MSVEVRMVLDGLGVADLGELYRLVQWGRGAEPREGRNPQIRLMEAVRYACSLGGDDTDIRELVEAALAERSGKVS